MLIGHKSFLVFMKYQYNDSINLNIYFHNNNIFNIFIYYQEHYLAHCFGNYINNKINYFLIDINQLNNLNDIETTQIINNIKKELIKIFKIKGFI